jgi:hypothetical protein
MAQSPTTMMRSDALTMTATTVAGILLRALSFMTSSPFHTAHKSQFGQLPSAYGTLRGPLSHLHDDFMLSPEAPPAAAAAGQSGTAGQRWCELIDAVVSLLTARTGSVFVDCAPTSTATVSSASQAAFATRHGGLRRADEEAAGTVPQAD